MGSELTACDGSSGCFRLAGEGGIACDWTLADGAKLHMRANFSGSRAALDAAPGRLLHAVGERPADGSLAPWSGTWTLEAA